MNFNKSKYDPENTVTISDIVILLSLLFFTGSVLKFADASGNSIEP